MENQRGYSTLTGRKDLSERGTGDRRAEQKEANQKFGSGHETSMGDSASEATLEQPTYDEIAVRAYQCWQERGGGEGGAEDDWRRAEEELRTKRAQGGIKARSASTSSS